MNFVSYCIIKKKLLIVGKKKNAGRNFSGKICVHGRGGGNKRNYIYIDFLRRINKKGVIIKIMQDLNRSALIGMVIYDNALLAFNIICAKTLIGDEFYSGIPLIEKKYGISEKNWAIPVKYINLFTIVSNIELVPYKGAVLLRSAGNGGVLIKKEKKNILVKLTSGWIKKISEDCLGTIGKVSNEKKWYNNMGKAGINRNNGFRSKVRGVAMNPCDHPHGGGNGKKSPSVLPKSPWNKITKWTPTNNKLYHRLNRKQNKKNDEI